ncbi:aldose epimerase [Bordetella sp.]|uniref:aldose epimerase family protein n=1 Tax=Bordetella sp. TaxID=28081 RepID=UPI0039C87ABD
MSEFQQQQIIEIADGGSRLRLAPQYGGRLLSWDIDGESVIHWPEKADWSRLGGVRGGNPLLFPFLGRHRVDGEIGRWRDAQGIVREVPMHGFARDLPFVAQIETRGKGVRMTLRDSEATRAGYPFGFRFEAAYRLIGTHTLEVELSVANTGDAPLPHYAGHHFYFTLPHAQRGATTLELPPTLRRYHQADGAIAPAVPGQPSYKLDDPVIHDRMHCLQGAPDRPVRLLMPGLDRRIEIDLRRPGAAPWYCVTTWTEAPDSDFYCVEPWLGMPDAIHNGLGLRWVPPGQAETAMLRISIGPLAARADQGPG